METIRGGSAVNSNRSPVSALLTVGAAVAALTALAACEPSDPMERIAEARTGYTAELTGFYAKEVEVAPEGEDLLMMEGGAEAAAAEEVGEEEVAPEPPEAGGEEGQEGEGADGEEATIEVPTRTDLVLDVIVSREGSLELPGLTLDISLVSADQTEKDHWLWWVETEGMPKGDKRQFSHTLEDVDYEEGDGLLVEIRDPVPPAERVDYREFREGTSG